MKGRGAGQAEGGWAPRAPAGPGPSALAPALPRGRSPQTPSPRPRADTAAAPDLSPRTAHTHREARVLPRRVNPISLASVGSPVTSAQGNGIQWLVEAWVPRGAP